MATVYIAPTSQGSANGTSEANAYAYSSLSSAETDAGNGGTILFTDGNYELSSTAIWNGIGSSGNDITYKSLNPRQAVIKSNTGGTLRQLNLGNTGNTSTINLQNFKFIDVNFYFYNQGPGEISGNLITCSTTITLPGNGFFRVYPTPSGSGTTDFKNNSAHIQYASGTYLTRSLGVLGAFSGNTIYVSGLNGKSANSVSRFTATDEFSDGSLTSNNIWATDDTANNVIHTDVSWAGSVSNNCFHQFGSNNTSGGTNNVFADPQFIDGATDDLRLRPSSPCINTGTAS